jgi:Fe-S oxidoreductase
MYFNPGCALNIYKPEMAERILKHLNSTRGAGDSGGASPIQMHSICCHFEPQLEAGSTIINVCAGCDRRFGGTYDGVDTISLWEILDGDESFPLPDYEGAQMSIHDPCPVRKRPTVHNAVRSLLAKMNIEIIEACHIKERSVCCGDTYYPAHPQGKITEKMQERADAMPASNVAVYCVSCVKSMHRGGKRPRYLVDLLFGEDTTPGECDTKIWHKQIEAYQEAHKS